MATSQNGWSVLASDSTYLHSWVIPTRQGQVKLKLRRGSAGFALAHMALWFNDEVEQLVGGTLDDWGYAYRLIRGDTDTWSNHASGTAMDLNATQHPLGVTGTFTAAETTAIRSRLKLYAGVIGWGGDWTTRVDSQHFEIARDLVETNQVAKALVDSPRGKTILAANPGQKAIILG